MQRATVDLPGTRFTHDANDLAAPYRQVNFLHRCHDPSAAEEALFRVSLVQLDHVEHNFVA